MGQLVAAADALALAAASSRRRWVGASVFSCHRRGLRADRAAEAASKTNR